MYKNKSLKKGYLSLEYVLLASAIFTFSFITVFYVWPKNAQKPLNVSNNEVVSVIGGSSGDKVGMGGKPLVQPDATASTEFEIATVADGISITGYLGSDVDIVIPSQINNQPVVEIGTSAFANKALESVLIPSSIKRIKTRAFDSNRLTEIDLSNVEEIGEYSFANNRLASVKTANLTRIPTGAFMQNKLLTVIIDGNVEIIGAQAFSNNLLKTVDIPEGVIQIGTKAFYNNEISTLYLGSTVSSIGDDGFDFQEGFEAGIVFIEGNFSRFDHSWDSIFDSKLHKEARDEFRCTALTSTTCSLSKYSGNSLSVIIPEEIDGMTVVEIGNNVFLNRGITSVTMPETIQKIGASAFEGNELVQLTLPASVRTIGTRAFANNTLKIIHVKEAVTSIEANAFAEQDIVNGTVFMSDATYSRFSSNWTTMFDSKLQRTK